LLIWGPVAIRFRYETIRSSGERVEMSMFALVIAVAGALLAVV
jgi:hypothetical protein